ncbi:MAG: hypothetical protein IT209_04275 [Armatimonadetes bacterium]|nr:hypothetical protein [Armatimonadota bacterium]
MDDTEIEIRLRKLYDPEVPDDVRESVLAAARRAQSDSLRRAAAGRLRWVAALTFSLLWILAASVIDSARDARLEQLAIRNAPQGVTLASAAAQIQKMRAHLYPGEMR